MIVRCIDFETTGVPTDADPHEICEVGWADVSALSSGPHFGTPRAFLTKIERKMPPEARAVHHISDAMLAQEGRELAGVMATMQGAPAPDYFCAHAASFEQKFFDGAGTPWIDTYKVAVRLWPDSPSHSLQVLRYFLDIETDDILGFPPHRAGPDAYICAALLARILESGQADLSTMVRWSAGPALLPRVSFGNKHRGAKWEDVPSDYLRWIVDKSDLSADVKANARHHLKMRAA